MREKAHLGFLAAKPWIRPGRLVALALASSLAFSIAGAGEVQWEGGLTAVIQDTDDNRVESELTASADLFARLPQQGGEWLLYIEASSTPKSNGVSAFYPTANGDARSVLTTGGGGSVQISEFNYTFFLNSDRSLMLGLINPSAWLDRSRIANDENQHFLNGSFVHNATIEYPDYTLGAVFRSPGNRQRPEIVVVVAGSDGIADIADRSYQDLLDLNSDERGVFVGSGASWLYEQLSFRVGAWLRSDDHSIANHATDSEMNYGAYSVFGWQSGASAVNLRAGFANSKVSIGDRFFAVSYQHDAQLGLFGIGAAYTHISNDFRVSGHSYALDSEAYFRIPILNGAGHVSPSVQYLQFPSLDATGFATGSSALVAGVRFHWSF